MSNVALSKVGKVINITRILQNYIFNTKERPNTQITFKIIECHRRFDIVYILAWIFSAALKTETETAVFAEGVLNRCFVQDFLGLNLIKRSETTSVNLRNIYYATNTFVAFVPNTLFVQN